MGELQEKNTAVFENNSDAFFVDTYWRRDEEAVVKKFFTNTNASILVLGCGAGRTLPHLHQKGFSITAVDISPRMLQRAKERCAGLPITFVEGDAANLPLSDATFEYIFFPFHGIDYVEARDAALAEAKRILKDGGVFIFNSHNLFFPRFIKYFFVNKRIGRRICVEEREGALWTYFATYFDVSILKKSFSAVEVFGRTHLQGLAREEMTWKSRLLELIPIIDKSLYFVCKK